MLGRTSSFMGAIRVGSLPASATFRQWQALMEQAEQKQQRIRAKGLYDTYVFSHATTGENGKDTEHICLATGKDAERLRRLNARKQEPASVESFQKKLFDTYIKMP